MLRILLSCLILSSCSMGTVKIGGERSYAYDPETNYTLPGLRELSSQVVATSKRDPLEGKLEDLFGQGQSPLKRVGIVIFESEVQPTRDGLAGKDLIYVSAAGKQLIGEAFLRIWEQSISVLWEDVGYVSTPKVKRARSFREYGSAQDDLVQSLRFTMGPDDIFYIDSGKRTTPLAVVNPRGMRDMSFLLVPGYELMGGPKWSEHNKQFLNDVSKDLKLDALIIVYSKASWSAAHMDKHSGEHVPEEIRLSLKASTLVPMHLYHQRLERLKKTEKPNVTLCYRSYESELRVPARISVPAESRNFGTIEGEVLGKLFKSYKDLTQMTILRIGEDLKKTW